MGTGSLLGSVPVALIHSFFVEYYVSSMTGAVKEQGGKAKRIPPSQLRRTALRFPPNTPPEALSDLPPCHHRA